MFSFQLFYHQVLISPPLNYETKLVIITTSCRSFAKSTMVITAAQIKITNEQRSATKTDQEQYAKI